MSTLLACFLGRHRDHNQPNLPNGATMEAHDACKKFELVWFSAYDHAIDTADINYLMVHESM